MATFSNAVTVVMQGIMRSKISIVGAVISAVLLPVLVVAMLIDIFGLIDHPMFGFLFYMQLGPLFIFSLLLVFIGVFVVNGKDGVLRFEKLKESFKSPDKFAQFRKTIMLVTALVCVNIFVVTIVSYKGYAHNNTVGFCGITCHAVMEPEYVTFKNSPHANITCVQCHVGYGTEWMVKSKIAGARKVLKKATNTYHKPLKTPVLSLRAAEGTCMNCHQYDRMHGDKLYVEDKFLDDEENSHVQTVMVMKLGSGGELGGARDIHWHASPDNQITFEYTDRQRQIIGKVTLTRADGSQVIYNNINEPMPEEGGYPGGVRKMDCIDCHNRIGHPSLTAEQALNQKIMAGDIPRELPFIKRQGLDIVTQEFNTTLEATEAISSQLRAWYQENYPEFIRDNPQMLTQAIAGVQLAYSENVFPGMRVTWGTYLSFSGHLEDNGCFRCHGGSHETEAGEMIPMDCATCHTIIAEDEPVPNKIMQILEGEAWL